MKKKGNPPVSYNMVSKLLNLMLRIALLENSYHIKMSELIKMHEFIFPPTNDGIHS